MFPEFKGSREDEDIVEEKQIMGENDGVFVAAFYRLLQDLQRRDQDKLRLLLNDVCGRSESACSDWRSTDVDQNDV